MRRTRLRLALEDLANRSVLKIKTSSQADERDIEALLKAAAKDKYLGDFIYRKKLKDILVFYFDNIAVGFAIPRRDSDGYYRTGPIFVIEKFRRKGIAKEFITDYFKDRRGRSWIEEDNKPSIQLYKSVGFKATGKTINDDDGVKLFEYLKE